MWSTTITNAAHAIVLTAWGIPVAVQARIAVSTKYATTLQNDSVAPEVIARMLKHASIPSNAGIPMATHFPKSAAQARYAVFYAASRVPTA